MRPWSDDIDPRTIPDAVLKSERARRNSLKRKSYTGGVFWKNHNPNTTRCRCKDCMQARQAKAAPVAPPPPASRATPERPLPPQAPTASQPTVIAIGSRVRVKGEKRWIGTVTYEKRIRRKTIWTVEFDHHGPATGQGWYTGEELILID